MVNKPNSADTQSSTLAQVAEPKERRIITPSRNKFLIALGGTGLLLIAGEGCKQDLSGCRKNKLTPVEMSEVIDGTECSTIMKKREILNGKKILTSDEILEANKILESRAKFPECSYLKKISKKEMTVDEMLETIDICAKEELKPGTEESELKNYKPSDKLDNESKIFDAKKIVLKETLEKLIQKNQPKSGLDEAVDVMSEVADGAAEIFLDEKGNKIYKKIKKGVGNIIPNPQSELSQLGKIAKELYQNDPQLPKFKTGMTQEEIDRLRIDFIISKIDSTYELGRVENSNTYKKAIMPKKKVVKAKEK